MMPASVRWARRWALPAAILSALLLARAAAAGGLASELDEIFGNADLKGAEVGVAVYDLETGKALYERNAERPLSLASNQKLVTTACALDRLGAGYRFETTLSRTGKLCGEALEGSLVLRGGGDPTISSRFDGTSDAVLKRFARALHEAGIKRVKGDVIADDRLFDRELRHPGWPRDQADRWYEAPVSALCLGDGCVEVTVAPGARAGAAPTVTLDPATSYFELEVRATTTGVKSEHMIAVDRVAEGAREKLIVRGAVLAGAQSIVATVTVLDPSMVFAATLRERLIAEGVAVDGTFRLAKEGEDLAAAVPLAAHESLLAEALPVVNKRSQNHYAEMILKAIGAHESATSKSPAAGSFAGGAAAVGRFLVEQGIAADSFTVEDGSGLSRGNRMAPRALATLLARMARHKEGGSYIASLAVAGADGSTLHGRLKDPALEGHVYAKTGTIAGVSALSGYVLAGPGDPRRGVAFVVLCNHLSGPAHAREAQDRCVEVLADLVVPARTGEAH